MGQILPKEKCKVGFLCSDIKNEEVIINEMNIAPKCYMYEYINNKNELMIEDKATLKCEGIPKIQT